MLIVSIAVGLVVATLLVAFLVGAKATLPYALGMAVLTLAIGFFIKTKSGKATRDKWKGLLVFFAVGVMAILLIHASHFVSEALSPNSEGNVKFNQMNALRSRPQPGWVAATHKIAMSATTDDLRKRLNGDILESVRNLNARTELSESELALTQEIFTALHGPMDKGAAGLSCVGVTGRILLYTTDPADMHDNLQRFPASAPQCNGRMQFLMSARAACSDNQSRWGKLCANDLPRAQLSSLANHPEMGPLIQELLAKSK
jgi:hypothetical protein